MAKIDIKTSGLVRAVEQAFKNLGHNVSMYAEIIRFSTDRIRQRARLSKRMETGKGEEKLPKHSAFWMDVKSKIKPGEDGTDPTFFRPDHPISNMTYSGQLLRSLQGKIEKQGAEVGKMSIGFEGSRKDVAPGEPPTNDELYKKLLDKDRNYKILALDKKATENIRKIVVQRIRQELKKMRLSK